MKKYLIAVVAPIGGALSAGTAATAGAARS
ncbi:hypothetical protein QFZ34_001468 [Phyllobacterium ifriqiyense]|uniref:Uncharacterized protein n=1 Tax=Phyllobacterium ifriqiyense TaxID=314238 RepID=A0ABU0S701_9HYPH|nr:hypothetical protein [Phyllobacterium ifriqiyense]